MEISSLLDGYCFCARAEGKSNKTIEMVTSSITYLERYLQSRGELTRADQIGVQEIRDFVMYLQQRQCYSNHPLVKPRQRGLSDNTVNCYLRSIRAFWSWLVREEAVAETPFAKVKIPKTTKKVIRSFSNEQLQDFLNAVNTDTPEGYRDYVVTLTLLDTGIRLSELTGLKLTDINLEGKILRVKGKGNKERLVPFGKGVQRLLWRYINYCRPEPALVRIDNLFLTSDGRPLSKNRIESRMKKYGIRAGINGVRCSPHTLRHTAAISFLRNGGDVFSLQRLLGHNSLEMTRRYCEMADVDVQNAHAMASPVDNLVCVSSLGISKSKKNIGH
jgi:integrase/recombinase XerD